MSNDVDFTKEIKVGDLVSASASDYFNETNETIKKAKVIGIANKIKNPDYQYDFLLTSEAFHETCWVLCKEGRSIFSTENAKNKCSEVIDNIESYIGEKCWWVKAEDITDIYHIEMIKSYSKTGYSCKDCNEYYPYAEPNQADGTLLCYCCRMRG